MEIRLFERHFCAESFVFLAVTRTTIAYFLLLCVGSGGGTYQHTKKQAEDSAIVRIQQDDTYPQQECLLTVLLHKK